MYVCNPTPSQKVRIYFVTGQFPLQHLGCTASPNVNENWDAGRVQKLVQSVRQPMARDIIRRGRVSMTAEHGVHLRAHDVSLGRHIGMGPFNRKSPDVERNRKGRWRRIIVAAILECTGPKNWGLYMNCQKY